MWTARRRLALSVGAIALSLIVGSVWLLSASSGTTDSRRDIVSPVDAGDLQTRSVGRAPTNASQPASQQGSTADGGVRFDSHGNPVTDAELRRYFDWYLAGLGEQDMPTLRARLARDLALRMTPAQRMDVLAWFDRYVAYQQASTRLAGIGDLRERLDAVHALRNHMLGANAAKGFFGEEETEAMRVLSMRQLQREAGRNPGLRASEQSELEEQSPGYAEARKEAAMRQQVLELSSDFDRQHSSAAERHAERTALLGAGAADRFAELDQQRAQWEGRLQAYVRADNALRARGGISETQRVIQARALLASFTPAERRRIASLDEAGLLR